MARTRLVQAVLSDEEARQLAALADEDHRTVAGEMRWLIDTETQRREAAAESLCCLNGVPCPTPACRASGEWETCGIRKSRANTEDAA